MIQEFWAVSNGNENMSPIGPFYSPEECEKAIEKYYSNGGTHEDPHAELVVREVII